MTNLIPDINLFVSMYVRKEALLTSQIEGTQATLEDVLDPSVDANSNRDVEEVINYIKALNFTINRLNDLPICSRLIREIHSVLMSGVRGQDKSPGEFRHTQNWIGGIGSTLSNASFIPQSPEDMNLAMSDLEKYINSDDSLDTLVQTALIHYQFETIHPFLDGNGRIGRLLIVLFLIQKGLLSSPSLYVSYFLKSNRVEYYDRLMEVRRSGNYEQWVKFFLQAIYQSAKDAIVNIEKLSALRENNIGLIQATGRASTTLLRLYYYLEENPIISITKTAKALSLSYNATNNAINRMLDLGILYPTSEAQRNKTFIYKNYLDILKSGML
ncbi:MAG: Fic family protein [Clostridiales bacterium]|jgi:Fic family protein|nr:Fic family protein [Clostridiales bacterium]